LTGEGFYFVVAVNVETTMVRQYRLATKMKMGHKQKPAIGLQ
jgi:hypothetical protein